MTSTRALIEAAHAVLEAARQQQDDGDDEFQLMGIIRESTDVSEVGSAYYEMMRLPAPPVSADPVDTTAPAWKEYVRWCESGSLPVSIEGLQHVTALVEVRQ